MEFILQAVMLIWFKSEALHTLHLCNCNLTEMQLKTSRDAV